MKFDLSFIVNGGEVLDDSIESLDVAIDFLQRFRDWIAIIPPLPVKGKEIKPDTEISVLPIVKSRTPSQEDNIDDMLQALYGCAFMSVPALKNRMIEAGWKPATEDSSQGELIRSLIKKYPDFVFCQGRFIKISEKGTIYIRKVKEAEK